jgi:hypothetical protein
LYIPDWTKCKISRLSSAKLQVRTDFNEQALQVSAPCFRVIKIVLFVRTEYNLCLHLQVHRCYLLVRNNCPCFILIFSKGCVVGGFNVSNLMGIKRRMIDIGKKITFYFLQNVWKCTVFFAFAYKKCYYDPKKIFLEKYQ